MVAMAAAELELDAMAACAKFSTTIVPRCGRSASMCLPACRPAGLPVPARPSAFLYQVPRLQWCQLLPARQHSVTCLSISLPFDTTPDVQLPPRA